MKADLSRDTFQPGRHYRDVIRQQGRVSLDATDNEQQAINISRIETETVDVVGASGAPLHAAGFAITTDGTTLRIGRGRYYVDGLLCENERDNLDIQAQPDRVAPTAVIEELRAANVTSGLVYLDVWLRHVTALNDPRLREVALGGPDTATRSQVVWQVRVLPVGFTPADRERLAALRAKQSALQTRMAAVLAAGGDVTELVRELAAVNLEIAELAALGSNDPLTCASRVPKWDALTAPTKARLTARTSPTPPTTDLCDLPPRAGFQRTENQLYRVEVHQPGPFGVATFKWSRDNGSVVTAIEQVSGQDIVVQSTGPDDVLGFGANHWVEMVDDGTELEGRPGELLQIETVPSGGRNLTMKTTPPSVDPKLKPQLRRWDQSGTAATMQGVKITAGWHALEDGVEVQFSGGPFVTGQYWLVPARTATGEVEWPPYEVPNRNPVAQPPLGIEHHYTRLAVVELARERLQVTADCRKIFPPLTELTAPKETAAVKAMRIKGTSWRHDGPLVLGEFLERGLFIDFDRLPDPASITPRSLVVTAELPMAPNTGFEPAGSRATAPLLSVILFGEITVRENQVRWLPVRAGLRPLESFFLGMREVVCRVVMKGGSIWSGEGDELLYLDGSAVVGPARGTDPAPTRSLRFPTGSGQRAAEFESWFRLSLPIGLGSFVIRPATVRLAQEGNNILFITVDPPAGNRTGVMGVLTLTGPAETDVVITLTSPDNREMVDFPPRVAISARESSVEFPIRFARRMPETTTRVTIVAATGGSELTATLTLVRP